MPQFTPAAPSKRNLALVFLKGSTTYIVRDVTDIDHPFTVSTLGGLSPVSGPKAAYAPQIVSGSDLSYYDDSGQLLRRPFDGSPTTLAHPCNGIFTFAWSTDGTSAAYVTDHNDYAVSELHIVSGGEDRLIGTMPPIPITGCVAPCDQYAEIKVLYSPSGVYVSYLEYWAQPVVRIWTADGGLVKSIDGEDPTARHSGPTMSVWSGNGFFFRDKQGVEVWRDGVQSLAVPGVAWIAPRASSASPQVVYEALDQSGVPNIYLLDSSTGVTRLLMKSRSRPAFLNARSIWYRGERSCVSGDPYPCGAVNAIQTGKTYIYDLQTGTEAESIITDVWDVWPHPA